MSGLNASLQRIFSQHILNNLSKFFLHHQIDLAQRDAKKILLSQITRESVILSLDFDFCLVGFLLLNSIFLVAVLLPALVFYFVFFLHFDFHYYCYCCYKFESFDIEYCTYRLNRILFLKK